MFCFLHYLQAKCGSYGMAGAGIEFDHLQIPRASRTTGLPVGLPVATGVMIPPIAMAVNGAFYLHFLELFFVYHCYTANVHWGFTGYLQVFPAISMKRAVRITEKPYTPQRERLCMLWGTLQYLQIFGKTQGLPCNLQTLQGFRTTYTTFPFEEYKVSL